MLRVDTVTESFDQNNCFRATTCCVVCRSKKIRTRLVGIIGYSKLPNERRSIPAASKDSPQDANMSSELNELQNATVGMTVGVIEVSERIQREDFTIRSIIISQN